MRGIILALGHGGVARKPLRDIRGPIFVRGYADVVRKTHGE